jgi:hypothetical protein
VSTPREQLAAILRQSRLDANLTALGTSSTAADLADEALRTYDRIPGAALPRAESLDFAGPVLAGILIATAGPGYALAVDAASFGVSALYLARLRLPAASSPPPADPAPCPARTGAGRGARYIGPGLIRAKTAPWGSAATAIRPAAMSNGGARIVPPPLARTLTAASVSSTAK